MRNLLVKRFFNGSSGPQSNSSLPFLLPYRRNAASGTVAEEEGGFTYGLNRALARKGVFVKGKAFRNLNTYGLQEHGATTAECLSGIPLHMRGNVPDGASGISKTQFKKLLKQVTSHISSIPNVFVHDGAIGSSAKCDVKVRVISDGPSPVLSLSNILWNTSARAISHDSCPLTVYVATSINQGMVGDIIGLGSGGTNGFIAGDIDRLSLVLCGRAFSDTSGIKQALSALSGPIIAARGGLPLSARLLVTGESVFLIFAPENTIKRCEDKLVCLDTGVVLSSHGVTTLFQDGSYGGSNQFKLPDAVIFASSYSCDIVPSVSRLSPRQAAYHFLAGYQNGKFVPVYNRGPSSIDPLELAKALLSKLEEDHIPSFLINVSDGQKSLTGKDFIKLVETTLSKDIPPLQTIDSDLQEKFKTFLSRKFQEIPEELSF